MSEISLAYRYQDFLPILGASFHKSTFLPGNLNSQFFFANWNSLQGIFLKIRSTIYVWCFLVATIISTQPQAQSRQIERTQATDP